MREFEFREPVVSHLNEFLGLELNSHEWQGANATFEIDPRSLKIDLSQYSLNEMVTELQNQKLLDLVNYILGCKGKSPINLQETPKVIRVFQETKEIGQFSFMINPKKKRQTERTTFVLTLIISDLVPEFYNQSYLNNQTAINNQDSPSKLHEKILADICGHEATTEDCVSEFPVPLAPYDPVLNFFKMDDSRNMSMMLDKQHRRTSSGDLKSQVLKASILQEEHKPTSSQRARSLSDDSRAKILKQEQSDSRDELSEDGYSNQKYPAAPQTDTVLNNLLSQLPDKSEPISAAGTLEKPISLLVHNIDMLIPEQLEPQVECQIRSSPQPQEQSGSGTESSRSEENTSENLPGIPLLETFRETIFSPYLSKDYEKGKEAIAGSLRSRLLPYQSQYSARIAEFSGNMFDSEFLNRFDKLMWSMELKLSESKFHKISSDSRFVTVKMIMQDAKSKRILIIYNSTLLNQVGELRLSKLRKFDFCEVFLPNLAARIAFCTAFESMKPTFVSISESPEVSVERPQLFPSNSEKERASARLDQLAANPNTAANILDQTNLNAAPIPQNADRPVEIVSRLPEVDEAPPMVQVNKSDREVIGSKLGNFVQPAQIKTNAWQRRAANHIVESLNFDGCSISTIQAHTPEESYALPLEMKPNGFMIAGEEAESLAKIEPFNIPISNKKFWPLVRYARQVETFHEYFGKTLTIQPEFNLVNVFCSEFAVNQRKRFQSNSQNSEVMLRYRPMQNDCLATSLRQYLAEMLGIELMSLNLKSSTVILYTSDKQLLLRFQFHENKNGVTVQKLFETAALLFLRIVAKECYLDLMKRLKGNWP